MCVNLSNVAANAVTDVATAPPRLCPPMRIFVRVVLLSACIRVCPGIVYGLPGLGLSTSPVPSPINALLKPCATLPYVSLFEPKGDSTKFA